MPQPNFKQTPEYIYTEKPIIDQLVGMGWQHLEGDWDVASLTERENFKQVIITSRLRQKLKQINLNDDGTPWLSDAGIDTAINRLERLQAHRLMEANQEVTELLLKGTTIEGENGKQRTVQYIEFEHPERNDFLVINQYRVNSAWSVGNSGFIVPDIVLLVNGIPLVVIECKSPKLDNPHKEAITDLLKYSNQRHAAQSEGAEKLFHYNLLMIAASSGRAAVGTIGASYEHYVEWKDTSPRSPADIAAELGVSELNSRQMLTAGMLNPANLLDILQHFTLFPISGGRTIKIVPRYQQYQAVQEAMRRLINNQTRIQHGTDDQRGGIIWHNQGSGKSYTMVFIVRKMRTMPELRRFKVVVVTDRTDLEKQLAATTILTGEPLQKARNVRQLEQALRAEGSGLVFGMIQKFRGDDDNTQSENSDDDMEAIAVNLNTSEYILVLIDEAHRSHTSTFHANLRQAIPNAALIGFTGTPIISKAKKRTTEIFGSFIGDIYDIKKSQADGVTVPIIYEGLEAMGAVESADSLDQLFDVVFRDKTPEERAQIKAKYATKSNVHEAIDLINAKAKHMLRHYVERILPSGFKAQVVAPSRAAAVRYQKALKDAQQQLVQQLESRAPLLSNLDEETLELMDAETRYLAQALPHLDTIRRLDFAAIISPKDDPHEWRQWTDKNLQDVLIERFKKPLVHDDETKQDGLGMLVVKSMLLTGFDAPMEQALYLDRSMRDHELLQAIARVNRTYSNKPYGLVIDYYGVNLADALSAYDSVDTEAVLFDIREELPKLADKHRRVIDLFRDRNVSIADVNACEELLHDERLRVEFADKLKDFLQNLDMVLPRPEALPFVKDAKQLGLIRKKVADLYRDEKLNLVDAGAKVRALIDQHIRAQGIDPKVPPIDILSLDFKNHVQSHRSSRTRAAEIESAARYHIYTHIEEDPIYYKKLSERLEKVLQDFAENWDAQFKALDLLAQDIQAGRPIDKTGLDPQTQLPFFSLLQDAIALQPDQPEVDLSQIAEITKELVAYIQQQIRRVNFWGSDTAPLELRAWIWNYLDRFDLIPFEQLDQVADRLFQLAKKNHQILVS